MIVLALILSLLVTPAAFAQAAEFKSDVRLVEVYATVSDHRGRPLTGLTREQFRVDDNGEAQNVVSFETGAADLSCAILLDTTGSMARALPAVKNAILRFLDQLRPGDSVAIYSFSTRLNRVQDFTTDKNAAKKAVLRTRARGTTALFDAVSQLARDLSRRSGKKVIVAFTDGQDNASALNPAAAMEGARKIGVPLYTVAQGEALNSPQLVRLLKDIAQATGGLAYSVRQPRDVEEVFQDISNDLRHTYMLTFKPPPAAGQKWRVLRVALNGVKDYKIRAREGYFPE